MLLVVTLQCCVTVSVQLLIYSIFVLVHLLFNVHVRYVISLPSVCLSVTFVHPTQATEIFGNVSTPFGTLAIYDPSVKILRRSSQGNPSDWEVKHKRGSRI